MNKNNSMKQTFQLISIFVLTLVIFVGYSKAPDYVADAIHLKRIGQNVDAGQSGEESKAAEADDAAPAEPVDTARQRLLLFGDSMTQLLALRLSDYANQNGHSLTCVTWNGSGTRQWASTDTLDHYMRTVRPTHVFICLGSNELYTADMKNCRRRVEQIMAKIGKVPSTWIGPPNWTEDKGINDMLQNCLGKRHFFMTKGMTLERQQDGRHPTRRGGVVWMDRIVEWINSGKAAHPFRLDKPARRCAKYRQIIIQMNPTRRPHAAVDSLRQKAVEIPEPAHEEIAKQPAAAEPASYGDEQHVITDN